MEKLFVSAKNYYNPERHKTKFLVLRYGNVLASSGSVIPRFIEQIQKKQKITITDPKMTRFSITMDEALDFILTATELGQGSEIFVPKLRSYSIMDVKQALIELLEDTGEEYVGIRPGEKLHETLISKDEIRYGWELNNLYILFNPISTITKIKKLYQNMKPIENMDSYSSDKVEKIPKGELKQIIKNFVLLNL